MPDIFTDALDAIHTSEIGVDGVFSLLDDPVRVIDKSSGVDLMPLGLAKMPTIVPAAVVRRYTLTEAGVTNIATLINTTLTMNGVVWKIINHAYRPQPGGEMAGELFLILRKA